MIGCSTTGYLYYTAIGCTRASELDRLEGLPRTVSMAVEACDVALPLVKALWQRLGDALSWLLVSMVGRGLGLVWRGIRMSMSGKGGGRGGGGGGGGGYDRVRGYDEVTKEWAGLGECGVGDRGEMGNEAWWPTYPGSGREGDGRTTTTSTTTTTTTPGLESLSPPYLAW